ncbi:DUF1643 domain-containing protein [Moraxella bovoculi]|nr:DUF1643 domain-containing protein [Moraxella bovoculi]
MEEIFGIISKQQNADLWVAWGDCIDARYYLRDCFKQIYQKLEECSINNWFRLDELIGRGHPKHPSRKSHEFIFQEMDIISYLKDC